MRVAAPGEIAQRIADHLVSEAVWSGDRCTWLGTTQDAEDDSDEISFSYGTLGPELYGGTSGVALFLLEVFRHGSDPGIPDTALGALRQAVSGASSIPPEARWGFFAGWIGMAWALARAGSILGRADLLEDSRQTIRGLGSPPARPVADVVSGAAGAIPALLSLAGQLRSAELTDLAIGLGRGLVGRAERVNQEWIWPVTTGGIEAVKPLTGFSHGAAGIGWALLELAHATGDPEFLEAGRGAFQYEEQWFRPEESNWPDFRESEGDLAPTCVAWCHGAPGIALTRLRAVQLGNPEFLPAARAGLATTLTMLGDRDEWIEGDLSLCHGRAGLGEVLRYAGQVLPDPEVSDLVAEAAADPVERSGFDFREWPCGVRRGSNPSLMLGLAGIGYFYLGLADPGLPHILLPGSGVE